MIHRLIVFSIACDLNGASYKLWHPDAKRILL